MSLLKRIEQGQTRGNDQPVQPKTPGLTPPAGPVDQGNGLSSLQARRVSAPNTIPQAGTYFDLKTRVQNKLLSELDPTMDITKTEDVRRTILELFEQILN